MKIHLRGLAREQVKAAIFGRGRCAVECQRQNRSLPNTRGAGSVSHTRNSSAVRNDDFGQQALRICRDVIQIELDQRRTRFDLSPTFTRGVKPVPST
jgi:hypothetical protein